ncbi:hypothetical protein Gotur_018783 [Gossypium turneri]
MGIVVNAGDVSSSMLKRIILLFID